MILPCWTSCSIACQISSQGVSRSTWCIWYRSMWSVLRRRSESSQARRMLSAESRDSLGQLPICPYTLVARTTFSRRPPPLANHLPMICSVIPSLTFQPYTLAVSKKLIPYSSALSITLKLSASEVMGPKFMVPRHRRLTFSPVLPRRVKFMSLDGSTGRVAVRRGRAALAALGGVLAVPQLRVVVFALLILFSSTGVLVVSRRGGLRAATSPPHATNPTEPVVIQALKGGNKPSASQAARA